MTEPTEPTGPTGPNSERGSATVWVLALVVVVLGVGGAMATLSAAIAVRHRAETAADLAALAAAQAAAEGMPAACDAARRVAQGAGVQLVGCVLDRFEVEVAVEADAAVFHLTGNQPARASARAGPYDTR